MSQTILLFQNGLQHLVILQGSMHSPSIVLLMRPGGAGFSSFSPSLKNFIEIPDNQPEGLSETLKKNAFLEWPQSVCPISSVKYSGFFQLITLGFTVLRFPRCFPQVVQQKKKKKKI